eukprot:4082596-Pyramimonas_sp.AAC.1
MYAVPQRPDADENGHRTSPMPHVCPLRSRGTCPSSSPCSHPAGRTSNAASAASTQTSPALARTIGP